MAPSFLGKCNTSKALKKRALVCSYQMPSDSSTITIFYKNNYSLEKLFSANNRNTQQTKTHKQNNSRFRHGGDTLYGPDCGESQG